MTTSTRGLLWQIEPVPGTADNWTVFRQGDATPADPALSLPRLEAVRVAELLSDWDARDQLDELQDTLNATEQARDDLERELKELRASIRKQLRALADDI